MQREEVKNKIIEYLKRQGPPPSNPHRLPRIQMNDLYRLFEECLKDIPSYQHHETYGTVREIIQEFVNNGFLYYGSPEPTSSTYYPFLSITEYGKEAFQQENWLPYDPEGYVKALKAMLPDIDEVTLAYIGESVTAYNRRNLLSATLTLGVASENLILLLIEAYLNWIKDPKRRATLEKKVKDKFVYAQYKEFKQEFVNDIKSLPKELRGDWETYLEGIFNFIRLNRNSAGHPTGKQSNAKIVHANLQIFAEYAEYISNLIDFLKQGQKSVNT